MKQKKKALLALAVLLCAAALLAGIYLTFRPQTVEGAKTVTVEVIAGGETVQTHTIQTDAEYLRGALEQEKMVGGEESAYGLFLLTVDGITADDAKQEWWCVTKEGGQVDTGVDATPIADGDHCELTLMVGW